MGLKRDRLRESLEEMKKEARASLAGSYLLHALGEFRSAGSAEALYRELEPWYTDHDIVLTPIQRSISARDLRLQHLRATVLFTALAAEGYANEFLATFLSGRALEGADRLSTVDKFVLGPRLAGLESPIEYGREPGSALVELFKTRNELVHTSPQPGVYAIEMEKDEARPYEPQCAARYLIQVARAAVLLHAQRDDNPIMFPAGRVWKQRSILENHVEVIGRGLLEIPSRDSEPLRDLMAQMHDRAGRKARQAKSAGQRLDPSK
jgi:hypothetical protein